MENEWKKRLVEIDDDYLVGISNKGIVKRAYKDLETIKDQMKQLEQNEESIRVSAGEETIEIRYPVAESTCSCPSRGICRHIVTALLALKAQEATTESNDKVDKDEKITDQKANVTAQHPEETQIPKDAAVWEELLAVPVEKLKKIMGKRRLQKFTDPDFMRSMPELTRTSVVTVRLQNGETVKLLSPLEYSTCTCHKKELCIHKAEAILWCQIHQGKLTKEALSALLKEELVLDEQEVKATAHQMIEVLSELLGTGLARISPEVVNTLERMALVAHNAQLANFEGYFRALAKMYDMYLSRASTFSIASLMQQVSRLYQRAQRLLDTKDVIEMAQYAGEFRAEYQQIGTVMLIGITIEQFESKSGYAGYTVYFLEQTLGKWYTYTDARPVYYENTNRRARIEETQTPWGLMVSLQKLSELCIELRQAKVDQRGRLSASKETIGIIAGERKLNTQDLKGWYYCDWKEFYFESLAGGGRAWLAESEQEVLQLFFLQPAHIGKAQFLETQQLLSLSLYDKEEREVLVEVPYSKKDAESIRYLEKMAERVESGAEPPPCFFGKVYLKEGRIRMYPIALFDRNQLCQI